MLLFSFSLVAQLQHVFHVAVGSLFSCLFSEIIHVCPSTASKLDWAKKQVDKRDKKNFSAGSRVKLKVAADYLLSGPKHKT